MKLPLNDLSYQPPPHWMRIGTIDMHTGGEPLRVVTSGLPAIEGRNVLEKRRYFHEHYDHLRTSLMWEPRGHADMYGAVLMPSIDADFDVFFLHNEGYSTMCGHAIIAITKLVIESGLARIDGEEVQLAINVPAGTIRSRASIVDGRAEDISFLNVPSFTYSLNQSVEVPGLGSVRFDVAYGGAFYAIVESTPLDLELTIENYSRILDCGRRIKEAVVAKFPIVHPHESDLSFLYGTIFTGPALGHRNHSRNVTVFADGEVDRSATGSGVSARAALNFSKGELSLNERITVESILGTTMAVRIAEKVKFDPYDAVIPEVSGTASFTGRHEFYLDPADSLRHGFILR